MTIDDTLAPLSRGFRERYLSYDELTEQLRAWAEAFPTLVTLHAIGTSPEGRTLWVLQIDPDPARRRPSAWVDGNMHASELCGSSVALAIAEDVLRLHLAPEDALHALPRHVRERLREVPFFILPRMSPDGAEAVLRDGRYVRSNPRDRRPERSKPRWISKDIDGDGLILLIRKEDPCGEFVESKNVPSLLLPRRLEDEGPYYKVYPEGVIEPWDGHRIPDPNFLSDNDTDLNRNFPWSWMPEPEQAGAGAYPASEPEARAVVDFTTAHPEIFYWLNLHTFGGVFIRPLGHAPDKKLDPQDLALFRQIGAWGDELTGYPTVSGFEDFLYEPDKPLHGDLADYAFHQRGAIAYVCELWDLFTQLGIARKKPFVDHYSHLTHEELERLGHWDREHNASRIVRPWRPVDHPQLGRVEVGGIDPRIGVWNPPYDRLASICAAQTAMYLRVAALAPALRIDDVRVEPLGPEAFRVRARVANHGYLPTYVLAGARSLAWNEPVHLEVRAAHGVTVDPADSVREVGHLEGWGRGLFGDDTSLFYQRSRGSCSARELSFTVSGRGALTLRAGSCRTGWTERTVELG